MTRVAVVKFPGSNCDEDTLRSAQGAGAEAFYVWHREESLGNADVVILPGGFAYGDHLRAGAIARFSPVMRAVEAHAAAGGPVLGICNGFQILCEAGLLDGALVRNACLTFLSRPVRIRVESVYTPFTNAYSSGAEFDVPIAHGEGRFLAREEELRDIEEQGRVVMRYIDDNPNGSENAIAGIRNRPGNVVGMMPHPERAADPLLGETRGKFVFESLVKTVEALPGGSP